MQFKIPQNVRREDKIVGPLTLKQMIICAIGGSIGYAIFTALARHFIWITWLPPVALVAIITIAFAFVRPLNLSFTKWIIRWVEFSLIPRKRHWIKSSAEVIKTTSTEKKKKTNQQKLAEEKALSLSDKEKKLKELNKFLEAEKSRGNT